jgi:putative aldouronate transport system substrate-binding protein
VVKKYSPTVKISTYWPDTAQFIGKDTWLDNPMYNRVKNNLGIEYTIHWQALGEVATQKRNADIAAGTLPDLWGISEAVVIEKMIQNGAIEEIGAIWEATASPLTKQKKQYPAHKMWDCVKRGDKLYGVAWTNGPGFHNNNLAFIRQDWLDKVGLKAPQTIDEITKTLKAFKDAKLSKFGLVACKRLVTWNSSLAPIFGAYGVMPTSWRKGADGKLVYHSILPQVKEALAQIRAWYKEGYIDPDFYTYAENDARKNVGANKDGIYFAPWFNVESYFQKTEEENPPMKMVMMPLPKGPRGEFGIKDSADFGKAVVFKKGLDRTKIEAAIQELNWHIESHVNWEKYQQYGEWWLSQAWAEGYQWAFDDKCELKKGAISNIYNYLANVGFSYPHMCYPSYQADIFNDILKWLQQDPKSLNKAQRFLLSDPVVLRLAESYLAGAKPDFELADEFVGVPGPQMLKFWADLRTLEDQTYLSIVTGSKPLEAFDDFVKAWKSGGGDQVTEEVNAWWAARK